MEQTTESRFINNKKKEPLRQIINKNNIQGSNRLQPKKNDKSINLNKYISPAQVLREENGGKKVGIQQNQQRPKNIWMSSIRDIIRDEPVKITQVKKTPVPPKQMNKTSISPTRPKSSAPSNSSSKPVFTMAPSLKNLMQQSLKTSNEKNISPKSTSPIKEEEELPKVVVNNKPKFVLLETSKEPKKVVPTMKMTQNAMIFHQSPSVASRSPSPSPKQPLQKCNIPRDNNRVFRGVCVFVFLIVMFFILFFLTSLF